MRTFVRWAERWTVYINKGVSLATGVSSGKSAPLNPVDHVRPMPGRGENHDHFYENHGPGYFSYGGAVQVDLALTPD